MDHDEQDRFPMGRQPGLGRALVALPADKATTFAGRPMADFVTQLIACRANLAAYRRVRKAEPETARRAYESRASESREPVRGALVLDVSF